MPELPEVETIRRGINDLTGRTIRAAWTKDELLLGNNLTEEKLKDAIVGQRINRIGRIGKYLLVEIDEGILLFSLRMTGNLEVVPGDSIDRNRYVRFELDDEELWFTTVRRFSRVHYFETLDPDEIGKIQRLGIDPLNEELEAGRLEAVLANRTAPIKTILMNQECLAGIGNIYANEICFDAQIDPRRSVSELDTKELEVLRVSTRKILRRAIELGGSSIRDFNDANGENGNFQDTFFVYGRDCQECLECGDLIRRTDLSGRSTFWCGKCQN